MIKYRFLETTSPSRKTSTSPSMARKLGIPHSKKKRIKKVKDASVWKDGAPKLWKKVLKHQLYGVVI